MMYYSGEKTRSNVATLLKYLSNFLGWRTNRRIIVFESDDWGSIRMPSLTAYQNLCEAGIDLLSDEGARYNMNDSLASEEDMSLLFEVLSKLHDSTGRTPVITPVAVVANPDFVKIRNSEFRIYFYEPFTHTLKRYQGCENSFSLWKEGISKRLFVPQFHGREHLNVSVWMRALQSNNWKVKKAFDNEMWGISTLNDTDIRIELQAAFDFINPKDLEVQSEVLVSGLSLFEELFGFRAKYFVPPNGPFSSNLIGTCFNEGIKYLCVSKVGKEPLGNGRMKTRLHWLGQQPRPDFIYLTRNCYFEPSKSGRDWIDSCLHDIDSAFLLNKPAVISSHRVNYIGSLNKSNRENGLRLLNLLLHQIIKKWPSVEFLTSAELGDLIYHEK